MGMGNRLLEMAMIFCGENNYTDVILCTTDLLVPVRNFYGKYNYHMAEINSIRNVLIRKSSKMNGISQMRK